MSKYVLRLDDACERRNVANWDRMERLLDQYGVRPLVGVIPHCEDPMMAQYAADEQFWSRVDRWIAKGWTMALHGYNHVYSTKEGGLNPVNARSEFAGESLAVQRQKIEDGVGIFRAHGIEPKVFFAPSHTFDENTLRALREKSSITVISDTVANRPYRRYGMTFVPQQSGRARPLPFAVVTFCYHPNTMSEKAFAELERFLRKRSHKFIPFPAEETQRAPGGWDRLLERLYFARR